MQTLWVILFSGTKYLTKKRFAYWEYTEGRVVKRCKTGIMASMYYIKIYGYIETDFLQRCQFNLRHKYETLFLWEGGEGNHSAAYGIFTNKVWANVVEYSTTIWFQWRCEVDVRGGRFTTALQPSDRKMSGQEQIQKNKIPARRFGDSAA
jgi:hypothetical protein